MAEELSTADDQQSLDELWKDLTAEERLETLKKLPQADAEEQFEKLEAFEQAELIDKMIPAERRNWLRLLAPDDAVDLVQQFPKEEQGLLIAEFDRLTRLEITALLAYDEDEAGGLMSPRFARLRPEMYVDESISYLRRQARRQTETITYAYVLDDQQRLLGVTSLRELFTAEPSTKIRDIMQKEIISVSDTSDNEEAARLLKGSGLVAVPVVDTENKMQGIITVDDVMDVIEESATEDIQKIGGMEALDAPYISTSFPQMVKKRGGWLAALFVGEMFTASAMQGYQDEISKAVVLSLFIPLIISSGGNSGSQASTLIIRSLALGEMRLKHWWRILARELAAGCILGAILGGIGFLRIVLWPNANMLYGTHYVLIGAAVAVSLVGVVIVGTIVGAMLPFVLSSLKLDPASASAPFVATIVDVTGLIVYFSLAALFLTGTVL